MKLIINSKNTNADKILKREVEDRFEKLGKYFSEDSTVNVTFSEERSFKKVEITVKVKFNVLRSEVVDNDLRTAVDKAIDKIEKQLVKYKDKLRKRNNDSIRYDNIADSGPGEVHNIVRNKSFKVMPMTKDEACFQLELLGHEFYMFLNEENDNICVVYKRKNGDYGLIEPEL